MKIVLNIATFNFFGDFKLIEDESNLPKGQLFEKLSCFGFDSTNSMAILNFLTLILILLVLRLIIGYLTYCCRVPFGSISWNLIFTFVIELYPHLLIVMILSSHSENVLGLIVSGFILFTMIFVLPYNSFWAIRNA